MVERVAAPKASAGKALALSISVLFVLPALGLAHWHAKRALAELEQVRKACAVAKQSRTPDQARLCSSDAPGGFIVPGVL